MKEHLINFETAKLAKENGFNITNRNSYDEITGLMLPLDPYGHCYALEGACPAPIQSLLQLWLRETHNIHIWIEPQRGNIQSYMLNIYNSNNDEEYFMADYGFLEGSEQYKDSGDYMWYDTYEDALEQGLLEALKLIK